MSEKAKAFVNFYAAIGALEQYVELDAKAKEIAAKQDIAVRFNVKNGPDGVVLFKDGRVKVMPYQGTPVDIDLYMSSPEKFNAVVDGTGMPIPKKGLFKTLAFMGKPTSPFSLLTDEMARIMRLTEFEGYEQKKLSTILAFNAMAAAIAEVGNHDEIAKYSMERMLDGEISIEIRDVCSITLLKKDGKLTCIKKKSERPRALMIFDSIDSAQGLISGELDAMSCVSAGTLITKGHMLMLENLNKILNVVPKYLGQEEEI